MLSNMFRILVDHIFPRRCLGCRAVEGVLLCKRCKRDIQLTSEQRCPVCKKHITESGAPCRQCRGKTNLDYLIVATNDHTGTVKRMLHFFKYRFVSDLESHLSGLVLQSFLKEVITNENLTLVPVPLHPKREKWRGFNQSFLLARSIGNIADIAVVSRALRRTKHTASQMTLTREQRLRNTIGAFAPGRIPRHKEIILIDDVATTRATLEACAKTLKRAGVRRVGALVVSRGT